jgi:hypothetical protein
MAETRNGRNGSGEGDTRASTVHKVIPMPTVQDEHLKTLAKHGASARIRELAHELGGLLKLFPDLEDSFDPDELPISFRLKAAGERPERKTLQRRAKWTAARSDATARPTKTARPKRKRG